MIRKEFYLQPDVVQIARALIGKCLLAFTDGKLTGGIITETEAYNGVTDRASHAYNGRRTQRTETMYGTGGITYVYFCYGMHHMLNIVTNVAGIPDAVLVRGILPRIGLKTMENRTGYRLSSTVQVSGPGRITKCLGIGKQHNGISLRGDRIWIEDWDAGNDIWEIMTTERIGIDYAEEDASLPYRFVMKVPQTKNPG